MSSSLALENGRTERRAVEVTGVAFLVLTFQTLGIIYSDIGTSPLYVLNGIWPATGPVPSNEDVIGGISAILWALTLLPLLKYVGVCLYFGTREGEGGPFALFQSLYPRKAYDAVMERSLTGGSLGEKRSTRTPGKLSNSFRWPLLAWSLLGTSLTFADGVFTPAVSVTSAVGGIAVVDSSITEHITPIAIAFLVVLFLLQPFGTGKLAFIFAPVTCLWLLLLAGTGIANITAHPGIFRAFDPSRAIMLFVRTGDYDLLAGVLLAVTGCEALFANLGQFNMMSIRVSFTAFVYPSLCLAYLGQGARLIRDGEAVMGNIFYLTIPGKSQGPLFWIIFVVALLATLIASQALITATFSLVQQLVNMKSLPPLSMVYTSDTIQGQVYTPVVNWALMVGTIVVVAAFKDLAALTNAYGFAVATVMFVTTCLIALQMRYVKGWPLLVGVAFFLVFGFFDGLFWGASLKKVPHGAWVPLMIGVALMLLMIFWTWAKGLEDTFDGANRRNLRHFIVAKGGDEDVTYRLPGGEVIEAAGPIEEGGPNVHYVDQVESYYYMAPKIDPSISDEKADYVDEEKKDLVRISTCAIFHKLSAGMGVPHSFVGFIRQWPALPRVVIFLSVHVLPMAHVSIEDRYVVNKVHAVQGFYTVTYYLGFRDDFDVQVQEVINRICALETRSNPNESIRINEMIRKCAETYTHIVPHYHVVSSKVNAGMMSKPASWIRTFLVEGIYRHMSAMFPETKNWLSSADEIIHVGVNAII